MREKLRGEYAERRAEGKMTSTRYREKVTGVSSFCYMCARNRPQCAQNSSEQDTEMYVLEAWC